ncbi:MAG: hypothetical protein ACR2G3_09920 [Solirubrobacterales bacterium]
MNEERAPLLGVAIGTGAALAGLLLASAKGAPYLTTDSVNGWIVLFAFGLLGALFAMPFAIERRMRSRYEESDRRWERSLLAWGAVAIGVLLAGYLLGVSADWASGSSLAGAAGLLITIEAVIVLGTMVVWLLSG